MQPYNNTIYSQLTVFYIFFCTGRSLGCHAAVVLSNNMIGTTLEDFVKGIVCLAYPLHAKAKSIITRDGPLHILDYPVLFVNGAKDNMARKDLLEEAIKGIPTDAQIYWVVAGDHDHRIGKFNRGMDTIAKVVEQWCEAVRSGEITREKTLYKLHEDDSVDDLRNQELDKCWFDTPKSEQITNGNVPIADHGNPQIKGVKRKNEFWDIIEGGRMTRKTSPSIFHKCDSNANISDSNVDITLNISDHSNLDGSCLLLM